MKTARNPAPRVSFWVLELALAGEVGMVGLRKCQKRIRGQAFVRLEDSDNVPIGVTWDAPGWDWVASRSATSSRTI